MLDAEEIHMTSRQLRGIDTGTYVMVAGDLMRAGSIAWRELIRDVEAAASASARKGWVTRRTRRSNGGKLEGAAHV
jgi:hypothetical protein